MTATTATLRTLRDAVDALAEHRAAWDHRWRDAYDTDAETDRAYVEHQDQLAAMRSIFDADA